MRLTYRDLADVRREILEMLYSRVNGDFSKFLSKEDNEELKKLEKAEGKILSQLIKYRE